MFSPVAAVPGEVLAHVFVHYVADAAKIEGLPIATASIFTTEDAHLRSRQARAAVTLSGVCRYWRDIVIDCSILWTNVIINEYPMWAELQVERTKQAPFTITLPRLPDGYKSSLRREITRKVLRNIVSKEIWRIEGIDIGISIDNDTRSLLNSPAPLLKYLVFSAGHDPLTPLSNIFKFGNAVSLNQIWLKNCAPAWTNAIRSNTLRHLGISYPTRKFSFTLRALLERLPALDSLELDHAIRSKMGTPARPVELQSLKRLYIMDSDGSRCKMFLEGIIAPKLSVLRMFAVYETLVDLIVPFAVNIQADESLDIIQHATSLFLGCGLEYPKFIQDTSHIIHEEDIRAWSRSMAISKGSFSGGMVGYYYRRPHWPKPSHWKSLLRASHFKDTTHFRVYRYEDLPSLLTVLADPTCLPSLRTLELHSSNRSSYSKRQILDPLMQCISERTVTGLVEVHLIKCPWLTKSTIDRVKRLVNSVLVVE
ncbi:uncharacterized protein FIBRA_03125 [Fibroporia radiculosa]|uniref:Uncharacterized protein n=1 Tax=Fibroporia radiculosa TaxID=599839 RepID=J4HVT6_9APHY|nr:uncharacterized protein FIBRA_03125 [Fibroporia radiculosa]CCM01077.1 predicted protein [Fibroporia radiculosa]